MPNNTKKLLELHALLVERGLEKTLTTLVSETAQVGKTNHEVQLFFESVVASKSSSEGAQTKRSPHKVPSKSSSASTKSSSSSSENDSTTSYKSAKDVLTEAAGSDSKNSEEHKQTARKRRLSLETLVNPIEKRQTYTAPLLAPAKDKNAPKTPFCRIRPEEVIYVDERLKDNRYTVKGGTSGDFGYKAHVDLVVKHGKGFTKEKNKKKRGSYGGGRITMESHSIKFA
ncbi:jun-like transcription factor [Coemansia sp. RSA 1933]|nr:jun-like transcription factor [Coemansia sp. RSA 1933]